MCSIRSITSHLQLPNPNVLRKETSKDVACYCQEGWPPYDKKLSCEEQATCENGCLLYGSHVVITLREETLKLLYLGHFGIERMKQLARTAESTGQGLTKTFMIFANQIVWFMLWTTEQPIKSSCAPMHISRDTIESNPHQSRNQLYGFKLAIMVLVFSKYSCIHPTQSTSIKATTELLEQDFAHFGYSFTIVRDNATSFNSNAFQSFCAESGIIRLTGAPYHHLVANGAAEQMVQSFKNSLKKSSLLQPRNF